MKVDKFIRKVGPSAYVTKKNNRIFLYDSDWNMDHNDWFLNLNIDNPSLVEGIDWSQACELSVDELEHVLRCVQQLEATPVEKRFSEKRYCLRWISDDAKCSNYLIGPGYWDFSPYKEDAHSFTSKEIEELKQRYPRWAPAIEAMKEPVEDDSDE